MPSTAAHPLPAVELLLGPAAEPPLAADEPLLIVQLQPALPAAVPSPAAELPTPTAQELCQA